MASAVQSLRHRLPEHPGSRAGGVTSLGDEGAVRGRKGDKPSSQRAL